MAEGGNIEFSPEKKGTLIKGNEIIKYTEKANGNYRLVFYKIKESNGKVPIICDAFDYCHKLDINDVSADELIDLIDKNNLMEQGGNVGDELKKFKDIILESKDFNSAFAKARLIKNVSSETANYFSEKYNPTDKLSMEEAFNKMYNEVKSDSTSQLKKGIKVEQEHEKTFKKVAKGKISVKDAIKETAEEHISENPKYYDELEKTEGNIESNNNYLVDKIKDYNALNLDIKKSKKGSEIFSQIIKLSANQDVSIKQDSKNYKIKAIQGNGKKLTLKGSNTKSKDYTISDDDFDFAKELIISGVVDARNYDKNGMYNDFSRLSPTEVKKAVLDIQKCKKSIPAYRLIEELKKQYEEGYFKYKQGSGGFIQRERVAIDEVDIKPISPYESCDDSIFTDRKKEVEKGKKQIIESAIYDLAAMLNIVETEQEEKIISESIRDLYNLKQII
jgi:hypothetical protein